MTSSELWSSCVKCEMSSVPVVCIIKLPSRCYKLLHYGNTTRVPLEFISKFLPGAVGKVMCVSFLHASGWIVPLLSRQRTFAGSLSDVSSVQSYTP